MLCKKKKKKRQEGKIDKSKVRKKERESLSREKKTNSEQRKKEENNDTGFTSFTPPFFFPLWLCLCYLSVSESTPTHGKRPKRRIGPEEGEKATVKALFQSIETPVFNAADNDAPSPAFPSAGEAAFQSRSAGDASSTRLSSRSGKRREQKQLRGGQAGASSVGFGNRATTIVGFFFAAAAFAAFAKYSRSSASGARTTAAAAARGFYIFFFLSFVELTAESIIEQGP